MYQIGIDIGGTNVKIGIIDSETMEIKAKCSIPFEHIGYEAMCAKIKDASLSMAEDSGISMDDVQSVGLAVPGSISPEEDMIINAYNLDYHNVPIRAELEKNFPGKPVSIGNDADVAALAELYAGAFRGKKTAVLITIGTGTGGGVIINGRMYKGGQGHGVEIGHMSLKDGDAHCTCGRRGCVEAYCTASWIAAQGKLRYHGSDTIRALADGSIDNVDAKVVIEAAKAGDPDALEIFEEFIENLSSAIASVCVLLDPEVIAIGGGISEAGDILYKPLTRLVMEKNFFDYEYKIVPARLRNDAGIVGAAMLYENKTASN